MPREKLSRSIRSASDYSTSVRCSPTGATARSTALGELRARRNRFITESSEEFGDIDEADVAVLLSDARRNA